MDALAAAIAAKRKSTQEEFKGRKYVKRSELEEARLRKLREEEVAEERSRAKPAQEPPEKRQKLSMQRKGDSTAAANGDAEEDRLPLAEVFRRLRALEQPVTLFGEDDAARRARLKQAAASLVLADEQKGGQQNNTLLELQRAAQKRPPSAAGVGEKNRQHEKAVEPAVPGLDKPQAGRPDDSGAAERDATAEDGEAEDLLAAFEAAAEAVKARREEESMALEDRIAKHVKAWCADWEADLERRPAEVKDSGPGVRVTTQFKQTMQFFKPMFRDLAKRRVPGDLLAGLWMIIDAIQQRNYLHAYDVYMRLAVGNAPWPIGVTSVGIHERSSREKISHVTGMNAGGEAHIMNDEATRKYLQAIKRLLTFMQRAYPTDPSRSVDFDGFRDVARGAIGAGSDKLALLEAEKSGTTWKEQGLKPAPHFMEKDGTVKIPQTWQSMVSQTMRELSGPARTGTPPLAGHNSPQSPAPRSPGSGSPGRVNKSLAAAKAADKPPGSPLRTS